MYLFSFLLVDDEKDFVDTLTKRLRQREFSADCVYSGQAALDQLDEKAGLTDVILLDIQMPEIDGIQTLELLKEKHPLPEIIMLTGHASVGITSNRTPPGLGISFRRTGMGM